MVNGPMTVNTNTMEKEIVIIDKNSDLIMGFDRGDEVDLSKITPTMSACNGKDVLSVTYIFKKGRKIEDFDPGAPNHRTVEQIIIKVDV